MNFGSKTNSVDSNSDFAIYNFSHLIFDYIKPYYNDNYDELVLLCIGTDRSTGDSLGPLVGYKLTPIIRNYTNVSLFGTLDFPVHAKNIKEKTEYIYSNFKNPFVLAIDASLGRFDKVGYINIKKGPLKPGLGVNKKLPPVGDISITGVVNMGGIMEYAILQNTRLNLVMNMADIIARSINIAFWMHFKENSQENTM